MDGPAVAEGSGGLKPGPPVVEALRSEEHTSELQSHSDIVCRLLLEKKKTNTRSRAARFNSITATTISSILERKITNTNAMKSTTMYYSICNKKNQISKNELYR